MAGLFDIESACQAITPESSLHEYTLGYDARRYRRGN